MPKYVTYEKVRGVYDLSAQTVKSWALRGVIDSKTIESGTKRTRLYDIESIRDYIAKSKEDINVKEYKKIIYTRVSNESQKAYLQKQQDFLKNEYINAEIIKDIGSGMDFERPGLTLLLQKIMRNEVDEVIITSRDRLLKVGFELFVTVCAQFNCRIIVCRNDDIFSKFEENRNQEMQEDLVSIINDLIIKK